MKFVKNSFLTKSFSMSIHIQCVHQKNVHCLICWVQSFTCIYQTILLIVLFKDPVWVCLLDLSHFKDRLLGTYKAIIYFLENSTFYYNSASIIYVHQCFCLKFYFAWSLCYFWVVLVYYTIFHLFIFNFSYLSILPLCFRSHTHLEMASFCD